MPSSDAIPLPAVMSSCGCRFKPARHRHDCQVLRDYIEAEKTAERVLNQPYQSYTIEFPSEVRVEAKGRVMLDPEAFIREHLDDYIAFTPEYSGDDRVEQFVCDWVINNTEFDLPGMFRDLVMDSDVEPIEVDHGMSGWSHDKTLALHEKLGLNEEGTAIVGDAEPVYDDPDWPVLFEEFRRHPPAPSREEQIAKATKAAVATWKATRRMFPTRRTLRLHDQAMAELDRAMRS